MVVTKSYKNPNKVPFIKPFPTEICLGLQNQGFMDKHIGLIIKTCLATGLIMLTPDLYALADTALDEEARKLYFGEFIGIAKWVIIVKGGWDTIHKMLKEDFEGAKKCFIQYIVIFCILLGLPTGLDKVQGIFERMS